MVFKKPYAFLIKHFRIIHLILSALYIILLIKVSSLLKYYNKFISGVESKFDAINHVKNYYLIAVVLSILICLIILALMHYKKKPKLLYIFLIAIYLALAVIVNISYDGLKTIYMSSLDVKSIRLYRDLLRIIIVFQYISVAFSLVRGLGFDIKKFNFKEDIDELQLDITDDEEVELALGSTETIKRRIRRRIRGLKYYYKENKIFIWTLTTILIVLLLSTITIDKNIVNKIYNEHELITTDAFEMNVLNTYITNKTIDNKDILKNGRTFLIVKIYISPRMQPQELNTSNLILTTNNNSYTSDLTYSNKFTDIGYTYKKQKITTPSTFLFIFNIDKNDINKQMQLAYAEKIKINITPVNLDEISKENNYKLNDNIDLSNTILSKGNISITKFEINNKFEYEYSYEIDNQKYNSKLNIISINNTILKLDMNYDISQELLQNSFMTNYIKIKYKIKEEEYTSSRTYNKTPGSCQTGLYIEVDKNIEKADSIWVEITIRNIKYKYRIK